MVVVGEEMSRQARGHHKAFAGTCRGVNATRRWDLYGSERNRAPAMLCFSMAGQVASLGCLTDPSVTSRPGPASAPHGAGDVT